MTDPKKPDQPVDPSPRAEPVDPVTRDRQHDRDYRDDRSGMDSDGQNRNAPKQGGQDYQGDMADKNDTGFDKGGRK